MADEWFDIINRLATTIEALNRIDLTEALEGYADGRADEPRPGLNRSDSYVQGWWAGQRDGGHRPAHPIDRVIARAVIEGHQQKRLESNQYST